MKVYSFFKKYVLVLLGVLAFASCSDDDNAGVMSSKVMLKHEKYGQKWEQNPGW